jgi:hypothetical protein
VWDCTEKICEAVNQSTPKRSKKKKEKKKKEKKRK